MMNEASRWRRAIAQNVGQHYAANPNVAAVMLGGSSARGHADRFSDLDMGVFWKQPPSDAERQQVVEQANADLIRLYAYDPAEQVWSDDFVIGRNQQDEPKTGLLVEVGNYQVDFVEHVLQQTLEAVTINELWLNLIAGIVDSLPLHGADLLTTWKNRAATFPHELAIAIVQRYGVIDHFWRWEMYLERVENLSMLYHSFTQVQQRVLHMLLALNHTYYFGFKWLEVVEQRLVIKPENLVQRLRTPYQVTPAEGARQVIALVEETFDLVEAHLPEVNIARLREIFRYQRPFWDHPPFENKE